MLKNKLNILIFQARQKNVTEKEFSFKCSCRLKVFMNFWRMNSFTGFLKDFAYQGFSETLQFAKSLGVVFERNSQKCFCKHYKTKQKELKKLKRFVFLS